VVYAVREQREGEMLLYGLQPRLAEIDQPVELGDFRLVHQQISPWASVPT
jgi:hypothetical protein